MTARSGGGIDGIGATQRLILRYLRRKGSASRAEIAELCGVTPAAVSMMTRDLLDRGVILEGARRQGGRGAPHVDLALRKSQGYALGIHATRYHVMLALLDFGGELVGENQIRGSYAAFADVRAAIETGAAELLAANAIAGDTVIGAGIAMPTRFRKEAFSLDLAEEVISWADSDLSAQLRQSLGCPVMIENDANSAAAGELTLGNSAGHASFAYLYLSEGIGSGIVINQQLYRGHLGNAGEIGALRARGLTRPSFEDLANWCREQVGTVPAGREPDIWDAYLNENPAVLAGWLERAGPEAARLAFSISAVLGPSAIYIGGSLPIMVRKRLMAWLVFEKSKPFEGAKVVQPQILLPDVVATDTVAFGAAAMILHGAENII